LVLLIHTADIHVGAFTRSSLRTASVEALEHIAGYAVDNNVKYLVIAGDLFERYQISSFELLRRIYRVLRYLREKGVKVIVSPGSHDSSPRGNDDISLLYEAGLIYIPRFEITSETIRTKPLQIDDLVFYGIPGLRNNKEIEYLRRGRVVLEDTSSTRVKRILLLHTSVRIAGYDPSAYSHRYGYTVLENDAIIDTLSKINNIDYIALGHIHFPVPLFDETSINRAYPGAPIGRDANDLYETYLLRNKYRKDRRFLLIDLSNDKPIVKSIWEDFNVYVGYYKSYYSGLDETRDEIKRVIKDLPDIRYKALILELENIPVEDKNKIYHLVREFENRFKIHIHIRSSFKETLSESISILGEIGDIEELERKAVEELINKLSIKVSTNKILELINTLGREPVETGKEEFYNSMLRDIKRIMEEILNVK